MNGEITETLVPLTFVYKNRVGGYLQRFLDGLKEKKILGVRCKKCRRVLIPPREVCGRCYTVLNDWVEVKQEGVLEGFTIGHVKIESGEIKDAGEPYIIGMIRLKNASSGITAIVKGVSPEKLKEGLKVRPVFKETTEGNYSDLSHFEVVSEERRPKKKGKIVKRIAKKSKGR